MPLRSGFKRKSTAKRAESSGGAASEHDVEEDLSLASTEEFENFRSIVRAIIEEPTSVGKDLPLDLDFPSELKLEDILPNMHFAEQFKSILKEDVCKDESR